MPEHYIHDQSEASGVALSRRLMRRMIAVSIAVGLVAGLVGSYAFVQFAPTLIPVDKRQVILQENSAAVDVAKKVSPSVVSITSETNVRSFFGGQQTQQGAGTGIIVKSDGLIITNKHVVPSDASRFSVFTSDGHEYKDARVVARDPSNDLAFIQINAKGLKAAELGDSSSIQVGQKVIAIGNALGQFQNTVTEGLISGIGRPIVAGDGESGVESLQNLLQTDAAINPGNSGGPLVNLSGQVIGINTAVAGNGAQNIGFAIPINEAKADIASVQEQGKIVRPYLGVRYVAITKEFASVNGLSVSSGAYVSGDQQNAAVVPGSPAAKAGIQEGDIILKIGGKAIDATHSLSSLISQRKVGDKVVIKILRDDKPKDISVTLQQAPEQ